MAFDPEAFLKGQPAVTADPEPYPLPFDDNDFQAKRKRSQKWDDYIDLFSKAHGEDLPELPNLARAVLMRESGGNPAAVSSAGAGGLMQIMPDTFTGLGGAHPDDRFNPIDNIDKGVQYLAEQLRAHKTPELALAAYNAGPGNVRKHGGIPPIPETQDYVRAAMGYYGALGRPAAENPTIAPPQPEAPAFDPDAFLAAPMPAPTVDDFVMRRPELGDKPIPFTKVPGIQLKADDGPVLSWDPKEAAAQAEAAEAQRQADAARGREYLERKAEALRKNPNSLYTPEEDAALQQGQGQDNRSLFGRTAGDVAGSIRNVTQIVTGPLRGGYEAAMGARARETEENLAAKAAGQEPGFVEQLKEAGQAMAEHPDAAIREIGLALVEDAPLNAVATFGLGAIIRGAKVALGLRRAGALARAAKTAGKTPEVVARAQRMGETREAVRATEAALTKPAAAETVGREVGENVAGAAAVSVPQAEAQGRTYGPADAFQDVVVGSAPGGSLGLLRAAKDTRISKADFGKVKDVAYVAGMERHPAIQEMLPRFRALAESPELKGIRFKVDPDDTATRFWSREELDAAGYHDRAPGRYHAAGQVDRGEVRLGGGAGAETQVEEAAHYLQDRLRAKAQEEGNHRPGPYRKLLDTIRGWEEAVRAEAKQEGVALPGGDELFAQTFTAHMGYADKFPESVRRVVLPDPILEGFRKLMGEDPALRGTAGRPQGDITGQGLRPENTPVETIEEVFRGGDPEARQKWLRILFPEYAPGGVIGQPGRTSDPIGYAIATEMAGEQGQRTYKPVTPKDVDIRGAYEKRVLAPMRRNEEKPQVSPEGAGEAARPTAEQTAAWDREWDEMAAAGATPFQLKPAGDLPSIRKKYEDRGVALDAFESKNGGIRISRIVVPKDARGKGVGTEAMREVIQYADQTGQPIALSPSADFGGSVPRLKEFYKRLGFVENKGRNKDFSISESMYRLPNAGPKQGVRYQLAGEKAKDFPKAQREGRTFPGMYDGKTRFEFDDSRATWAPRVRARIENHDAQGKPIFGPLSRILIHPELYRNYPKVAKIPVALTIDPTIKEPRGHLSRVVITEGGTKTIQPEIKLTVQSEEQAREALMHEIQHAIQYEEDFAKGGSWKSALTKDDLKRLDDPNIPDAEYLEIAQRGRDAYMHLAGEIEARDTGNRSTKPYALRRQNFERAVKLLHRAREVGKDFDHSVQEWMGSPEQQRVARIYKRLEDLGYGPDMAGHEWRDLRAGKLDRVAPRPYSSEDIPPEKAIVRFQLKEAAETAGIPEGRAEDPKLVEKARQLWKEKGVESPFFRKWFKGSKVVDAQGKPQVVYHGTTGDFSSFDPKARGLITKAESAGKGFFFIDRADVAREYAGNFIGRDALELREKVKAAEKTAQKTGRPEDWDVHDRLAEEYERLELEDRGAPIAPGANIMPAYLRMQNPRVKDFAGADWREGILNQELDAARKAGQDGVIFKNIQDDPGPRGDRVGTVYVAFNPEQIKSATGNRGTFDAKNQDIRFQLKEAEPDAPLDEGKSTGTPPRVERRVDNLRQAEAAQDWPPSTLDRETKRGWEELDPEVRKLLREKTADDFMAIVKKGDSLRDAEVQAFDALVRGKREKVEELRQASLKDPGNAQARQEYLIAQVDYIAAEKAMINDGTGTARALAARNRIMRGRGQDSDANMIRKLSKEIPGMTDKGVGQLVRIWRESPEKFPDALRMAMSFSKADKALELWKAGLLSAFSTDLANVTGNALEHATRMVEAAVSGGVDWGLQKLHGGQRTRFLQDAAAEFSGTREAFFPALKGLARGLLDVATLKDKPIDMGQKFEFQTGAVGGTLGKVARTSFRKLEVEDQFFKDLIAAAELRKHAFRKAHAEGKKGRAAADRAAEIERETRTEPEKYTDILRAVKEAMQDRTFQGEPGKLAKQLLRMNQVVKPAQVVLPFVKTPANILRTTLERSPAGWGKAAGAYKAYRKAVKDGAKPADVEKLRGQAADAIGRAGLGTALLGGFAAYAAAGGMTGGGPASAKEKNLLREAGWQPYSFVFLDGAGKKHYIPFNRFEPIASLLGFAADLAEIKDQEAAGDMVEKGVAAVAENLLNKSYLQGLADAAAFINEPKMFGRRYVSNLVGSLVPNIVNRTAKAIDPVVRDVTPETTGFLGFPEAAAKTVQSRLPFASRNLPARRSGTGKEVVRSGSAVGRFAGPVQFSEEKEGAEVNEELVSIGYAPSAPPREVSVPGTGKKVRVTDDEFERLAAARAKAADRFARVMRGGYYQRKEPEERRKLARDIFDKEMDIARRKVLPAARRRIREG